MRCAFLFHPATMTPQIAGIGEGNEHKRGIQLLILQPLFVSLNGKQSLKNPQVGSLHSHARGNFCHCPVS
jgi:hypothetical protein